MNVDDFLSKLRSIPEELDFSELMTLVDSHYTFSETAFSNGDLHNAAGENSGSCKLFSFAKLNKLDKDQTLACFGEYYRNDVLQHPDADNHQNIRNFMKTGWKGVSFENEALLAK